MKNLIVKVPLVRVNVSGVASNAKPPRQLTPVGNSISGAEVKLQAADPCRAKVINMKHSRDPHLSSHSLSATSDDITQTPPLTFEESRKERTSDPLTLIVSIDRDSLNQLHRHTAHSQPDVSTGTTASACEATQSLVTTAEEYSHPPLDCDKQPIPYSKESTPPSPHDMANVEYCGDRGYVDSGGVWRKWTDPIIHTDSFAVNVLPYVYVDGMDDDTGET